MSVVGSAEKELYRLHVHSDFTRWYEDCRPILDDMARIAEVTVLELLPTVLDDTLCMALCEWKTDFLFGTIEDTLGYLEEWMWEQPWTVTFEEGVSVYQKGNSMRGRLFWMTAATLQVR